MKRRIGCSESCDAFGREWARISQLKPGDKIELDGGFSCVEAGPSVVGKKGTQLYFMCREGTHWLIGQTDNGEHCVGVYPA